MADATYEPAVYRKQGAKIFVVTASGRIDIEGVGKITDDGTQASAITNIATSSAANLSSADRAKINNMLAALRGVGIIAP